MIIFFFSLPPSLSLPEISFDINAIFLGLKLKGSLLGRITCRPVTIQYEEILSKLKEHKKLLELEISKASTEEALGFYAKFEEMMDDSKLLFNSPNQSTTDAECSAAEQRGLHYILLP
jgi:hypothetical protein